MVLLSDILDLDLLEQHMVNRMVNAQRHPELPLTIYNYSQVAQFSQTWDNVTTTCRGLIASDNGDVVARPFRKFFNYGQAPLHKFVVNKRPFVTTKMDGSLGICYPTPDGFAVATRGSFSSDQAVHGTAVLNRKYPEFVQPKGRTYLFEIIYATNRIVVDYGDIDDLVLIAVIDNTTGEDIPLWEISDWPGPVVDFHADVTSLDEAYKRGTDGERNTEGLVCCWITPGQPSFRLKIKQPDYVDLHRIVTGVSSKSIWEALSKGESMNHWLEAVPDEFFDWAKAQAESLRSAAFDIEKDARAKYNEVKDLPSRRKQAEAIVDYKYKSIVFSMLDGKDYMNSIWTLVKPTFERPFYVEV